jgi:hypothetical protein
MPHPDLTKLRKLRAPCVQPAPTPVRKKRARVGSLPLGLAEAQAAEARAVKMQREVAQRERAVAETARVNLELVETLKAVVETAAEVAPPVIHIHMPDTMKVEAAPTETVAVRGDDGLIARSITRPVKDSPLQES